MNMTVQTSTRIAPIVDVSTYDGPFGYAFLWSADQESEHEEGRFVCDDYDSAKMRERIVEEANKVFTAEKPLEEYGVVSIKATKFASPREYNFMTDWLDFDVEVDDTFWAKAKAAVFDPKNRSAIVKYAGDHWVSYDGFLSSMLNRISDLSRDTWRAEHCGTHMATDKEVEDALMADLEEAFDHLEHGTGDDDFREFGAILALLWLIEYPADFDSEGSFYGSWVTDAMIEHLRGNSSLSEFCTVLEPDEVQEKVGDALIDFDGFLRERELQCEGYARSSVGEDMKAKAQAWLAAIRKDVAKWKGTQRRRVEEYAPKWDKVRDELANLREEWEAKLEAGWPEAWR